MLHRSELCYSRHSPEKFSRLAEKNWWPRIRRKKMRLAANPPKKCVSRPNIRKINRLRGLLIRYLNIWNWFNWQQICVIGSKLKQISVSPDFFHFPWLFPDHFQIPWLFQVFQMSGHPVLFQCWYIFSFSTRYNTSPCLCTFVIFEQLSKRVSNPMASCVLVSVLK